jgi:hypothetical protein
VSYGYGEEPVLFDQLEPQQLAVVGRAPLPLPRCCLTSALYAAGTRHMIRGPRRRSSRHSHRPRCGRRRRVSHLVTRRSEIADFAPYAGLPPDLRGASLGR